MQSKKFMNFSSRKFPLIWIFIFIISISLISEDLIKNPKIQNYTLEEFIPKDLSKDKYQIKIKSLKPQEFYDMISTNKTKKVSIEIGDIRSEILKNSAKIDKSEPGVVTFLIKTKQKLEMGQKTVSLFIQKNSEKPNLEVSKIFDIPSRNSSPGKQPFIHKISPGAGKTGDTITITGENFGSDLDHIYIQFTKNEKEDDENEEFFERKPFYLSPIQNTNQQEIKFNLPPSNILPGFFLYRQNLSLKIFVNGRPSDMKEIVLLSEYWRFTILSITLFILIGFHIFIVRVMKKPDYLNLLILDKTTNTYSLSRFQALAWTVLLLGGYFYITLCSGVLLGDGIIPDFNPSLIGLLSISYGGLITAHSLGSKKPKNEILKTPPLLNNLFSSGDTIDLPRLQLFAFTIIGIIIYVYNLLISNPLMGLPDIPSTFLGLLGVSQTGYITGKFVSDKVVINQVKPYYIPVDNGTTRIHILGAGFVPNMKILLEEEEEPISIDFINSNAVSFILPEKKLAGIQKITILHNDFAPVVQDNSFEIIKLEPAKLLSYDTSPIILSAGKIPPGTELEMKLNDESYRLRGNLLPQGMIEFKSPSLPPGNYEVSIFFKNGADFEKIKYNKPIEVTVRENIPAHTIIKEEEIDSKEDSDLPDRTEMPWYMDNLNEEDFTETRMAIELEENMEELKISEITEEKSGKDL